MQTVHAVVPDQATFLQLAEAHNVVPVTLQVVADRETAVTAFEKLVGDAEGFLLESVEGGERWAQWSFLGWDPHFTFVANATTSRLEGEGAAGIQLSEGSPLTVLEELISRFSTPHIEGLPPLHSGLVGYFAYDVVRQVEHLPNRPEADRDLPEMVWQFVGALAAVDRIGQTITLVRNVFVGDDPGTQYEEALALLSADADELATSSGYTPQVAGSLATELPSSITSTMDQSTFEAGVESCREFIRRGDAYQIVLSQRLGIPFTGDTFEVYRALRLINPSPFLYYLRHAELDVVGSSPELMTRVRDGIAYSRPIAGTKPRGSDEVEDARLAAELLSDPKERAEHVMLIDLARNDLGRVCEFGSVHVDDLMVIERYSHVMHIVSGVSGKLKPGTSAIDVIRATFPHGTVSGAPKVGAMEIIDSLEPVARGPYAGALGYIDFSGNIDTAICLRTVICAQGTAWVQAGAGLVADSDPTLEYEESMNKAAAALAAVEVVCHGWSFVR